MKIRRALSILVFLASVASSFAATAEMSNWVIAATELDVVKSEGDKTETSSTIGAAARQIPQLILGNVTEGVERIVVSAEKFERDRFSLLEARQKLFNELTNAVKKRDEAIVSKKTKAEADTEIKNQLQKIEDAKKKIDENLAEEKKLALEAESGEKAEKENNNFFRRLFNNETEEQKIEKVSIWKNDTSSLFTYTKNYTTPFAKKQELEKAVTGAKINGLMTGTIKAIDQYISVEMELRQYPGGELYASAKEIGTVSDTSSLAASLSRQLLPSLINTIPVKIDILITPEEKAQNSTLYIGDEVYRGSHNEFSVQPGIRNIRIETPDCKSVVINYNFVGQAVFFIDVELTDEKIFPVELKLHDEEIKVAEKKRIEFEKEQAIKKQREKEKLEKQQTKEKAKEERKNKRKNKDAEVDEKVEEKIDELKGEELVEEKVEAKVEEQIEEKKLDEKNVEEKKVDELKIEEQKIEDEKTEVVAENQSGENETDAKELVEKENEAPQTENEKTEVAKSETETEIDLQQLDYKFNLNALPIGKSGSKISVNGNSYLGELYTPGGWSSFFIIDSSNVSENSVLTVKLPAEDLTEKINRSRRQLYSSYGYVMLAAPIYFVVTGIKENKAAVGASDAQVWEYASYGSIGLLGGALGYFVFRLVKYLLATNEVLPKKYSAKNMSPAPVEIVDLREEDEISKEYEEDGF